MKEPRLFIAALVYVALMLLYPLFFDLKVTEGSPLLDPEPPAASAFADF